MSDVAQTVNVADAGLRGVVRVPEATERDEREAEVARERYRAEGLALVPTDDAVAPHLEAGEGVLAGRWSVLVHRDADGGREAAAAGPLYLTTRRLLLLTPWPMAVELSLIDEVALAGERLLLSLRDGTGLSVETPGPRLLRVQIAAALIGARG